jgi:hypothetical protein
LILPPWERFPVPPQCPFLRLDSMTRTLVLHVLTSIVNNFWSCRT